MRKIVPFLAVLIVVSPLSIFAETLVQKPDLPEAYQSWPETYKAVCFRDQAGKELIVAMYAQVDSKTKTAEFVSNLTTVQDYYVHQIGVVGSGLSLFDVYKPAGNGWKKLDALKEDKAEADEVVASMNSILDTLCPKVDKETDDFFAAVFKKAKENK